MIAEVEHDWAEDASPEYLEARRANQEAMASLAGTGVYPVISRDFRKQRHYIKCRMQGTSHKLSEMFALAQPPMSNSDREFLQGRGGCYDQFDGNEFIGSYMAHQAKKARVDTTGKVYMSTLARFPGDPEAWVSGRGDVQRICETRGWGCQGSVNIKRRELDEDPPTKGGLASDLVDELVERRLEEIPPGEKVDLQGLRQEVIDKHAPQGAKREIPAQGR